MAIEKRKLCEVELAETISDDASILVEENGVIKRVSLESIEAAILAKIADGNKEEY